NCSLSGPGMTIPRPTRMKRSFHFVKLNQSIRHATQALSRRTADGIAATRPRAARLDCGGDLIMMIAIDAVGRDVSCAKAMASRGFRIIAYRKPALVAAKIDKRGVARRISAQISHFHPSHNRALTVPVNTLKFYRRSEADL